MFKMKVEKQLNILADRTILLGNSEGESIPENISLDGKTFHVLGKSPGVVPPLTSLEIEKTNIDFVGKTIN